MLLFLDSADLHDIENAIKQYPIDGVTTNPTILARDIGNNVQLKTYLQNIRNLTIGKKLFVQVTSSNAKGMIEDAMRISETLGGDLSIKIPSTSEGMEAIKALNCLHIRTTATACYSIPQAFLAAKSGAEFVAPYISHLDNMGIDGASIAGQIAKLFVENKVETQVLAASFRTLYQVQSCITNGATAITVTAQMLGILSGHSGTEHELDNFRRNWSSRFQKGIAELLAD